jgi:DNA primase
MTNPSYIAEKIKMVIDVKLLLNHLGADIKPQRGDEIPFRCLNPDHDDKHASCYYNVKTHQFNCLGCSWGGSIFSLIMLINKMSYHNALRYLKDFTKISDDINDEQVLIKTLSYKQSNKEVRKSSVCKETNLPALYENDFNKANSIILEYINRRKIDMSVIEKYYIGYCNEGYFKNRLILPIIHFDTIVGFSARATWDTSINKQRDERYLFESNSPVGQMIWGLFNNYSSKDPIFVEGIFDALRLRQYGLNSFSCLNNDITDDQIELIKKYFNGTIYIMPDNDRGGLKMIENFHKKIYHYLDIRVCKITSKDPDELTIEEAFDSFNTSISILDYNNVIKPSVNVNRIIRKL